MSKKNPVPWRFTFSRKKSLAKAQRVHKEMVELGKRAYARGARIH